MTNEQIIADIASSIYGEDTVMNMIENGEDIPVHTAMGWRARGSYRVKQGEHGIEVRLWKKRKRKDNDNIPEEEEFREVSQNRDFYMAKAFLFTREQVQIENE